jgi:glutamate dehydrogenase/leucine dehydrogenase
MHASGVHIISSGANVPFADEEIFYGPIAEQADKQMSCIPDFISNCGMARVFAYLMQAETMVEEEAIFSDVSQIIYKALSKIRNEGNDPKRITERAYAQVLNELV